MAGQLSRGFALLFGVVLSACAATVPAPLPTGTSTQAIEHAGATRSYVVHVPASPAGELPLVVDLHGLASSPGAEDLLSGFSRLGASRGFVVAQPAASGGIPAWDPSPSDEATVDDVGFVLAVIEDIAARTAIDRGAVFVAGFSNGAGMAHRVACEAAETVAGLATVAGAYFFADPCSPQGTVPVIAFHGTNDPTVPFEGLGDALPAVDQWAAAWADRDGCSSSTRSAVTDDVELASWADCLGDAEVLLYTVTGGGHGWPGTSDQERAGQSTVTVDATSMIWDFFSTQVR